MFQACLAPLRAVCRPPLDQEAAIGYFNALGDLPGAAIFAAASEIAASRKYPTWPMPGEIRETAVRMIAPQITPGEAWRLALIASHRLRSGIDFKDGVAVGEWNALIWEKLPPAVAITLRLFGGETLTETTTAYAQFRDEYERQVTILRRPMMQPAHVKLQIASMLAEKLDALPFLENSLSPAAMRAAVAMLRNKNERRKS